MAGKKEIVEGFVVDRLRASGKERGVRLRAEREERNGEMETIRVEEV